MSNINLLMAPSTPPVFMGAILRLLSKVKKKPYIYHCQDLQPEVGLIGGYFKRKWVYKLLLKLEQFTTRDASVTVVLSRDMAKIVQERGRDEPKLVVFNNFILDSFNRKAVPQSLQKQSDKFRVLFTGNHGVYQGLEYVIQAAWLLKEHSQINFQFIGEGLAKEAMMKQAGGLINRTVFFHSFVSPKIAYAAMLQGDIGLVPLQPGVYKYAFPSKTMMLLAAGLPLLVVVETGSELARFVQDNNLGWISPPQDAATLAQVILGAYKCWNNKKINRKIIQETAEHEFGIEPNLNKWSELIESFNVEGSKC